MPKLEIRKTKEIVLPSYSDSKVVIYDGVLIGDLIGVEEIKNDTERGLALLVNLIKEWNFTDNEDKPLPINRETIGLLPLEDINVLMIETSASLTSFGKKKMELEE